MADVKRNPKDSMKSTWRTDKSVWNIDHWQYEVLGLHPNNLGHDVPVHNKTDKIPFCPNWQHQRWVLFHASIPLALHQLYIWYTKHNMHPVVAFIFYTISFKAIAIKELHLLRRLGHQYGFLDGDKHARDEVPDHAVSTVLGSLISTAVARPLFSVFLSYRTSNTPLSMNWLMLPLEIGLYGVVLDFWFYWYHRLMHQYDSLWKYHRTHHLTKHPNPLLTLYADHEQEFFDIAGIPLMTYATMKLLGFPMGFYEWWICQQFIVYTELFGHSGLRLCSTPPSPLYWLLSLVQADLVIEDHDLHHRTGWKKSHNYGKQTRLWDRLFGTCAERIESTPENVDYGNRVSVPLW
ncbi:Verlamelin biosynthesis A [Hyphodiscus hymeniophilus]|uniref:Verlamelin biosynthesis A n=1 Tax=Hyphodiscus hymeniophilus TaxID=353542 RepID=A0A9P6SKF9_9HELO|nr:Verlamelin biosynthesis A [Hyphodiscus hymeniophilus]